MEAAVREALALSPVVFLNGPRQAGKSTLAKHLIETGLPADYLTFDDLTAFAAASSDPEGFLRGLRRPVVLDEVQLVPGLFRVLKSLVDERRSGDKTAANGGFLLTGSASVLALPALSDALVGRMSVLTLYPFSASETLGHGQPVINGLFDQDLPFGSADAPAMASAEEAIGRATFPEISGAPAAEAAAWLSGYITTLLQRDVRQLAEIERVAELPNILNVLASRAAGLLNDADSARDAKLNAMTYRRYRTLLQQLFLIVLVPPWFRNVGKRFAKSPKLYFADTALLCHQLGVDFHGLQRRDPSLFGKVVENFVASELLKQIAASSDAKLHHFRTRDGREVDFVVERRSGALIGVEVKSSATVTANDFVGLKALKEAAGSDFVRGIVLYLGRNTISFGEDLLAMPLSTLWTLNMDVSVATEIETMDTDSVFWTDYGRSTRVRCVIARATISDHFHNHATAREASAAIKANWRVIWPIFERKIRNGQIETKTERGQIVRQVVLAPQDFGFRDFRKVR